LSVKHLGDASQNSESKLKENSLLKFIPFINNFEQLFEELDVPSELRVALSDSRLLLELLQGNENLHFLLMRGRKIEPCFVEPTTALLEHQIMNLDIMRQQFVQVELI
jgi:hypothetical protein